MHVITFSNGDPIKEANTDEEWIKAGKDKTPAWCYYNHDPNSETVFGKLYNWFAVNDKRGLAPKGWHIPSNKEWFTLFDNTDAIKDVRGGDRLKATSGWDNGMCGTNKSGLSVLPAGDRWTMGAFYSEGRSAFFWTSTDQSYFEITTSGNIINQVQDPTYGMACRCVKD